MILGIACSVLLMTLYSPVWAAQPAASHYVVKQTMLKLYDGPGLNYPVRDVGEQGDVLTLIKHRGPWVKVRSAYNTEGWIYAHALPDVSRRLRFGLALTGAVDHSLHPLSGLSLYVRRNRPVYVFADVRFMTNDFASTRFYLFGAGYERALTSSLGLFAQGGAGMAEQHAVSTLVGASEQEFAAVSSVHAGIKWQSQSMLDLKLTTGIWSVIPDTERQFLVGVIEVGIVRRF